MIPCRAMPRMLILPRAVKSIHLCQAPRRNRIHWLPALQPYRYKTSANRSPAFNALTDVSLTLWPGEVHALMGENGAGKSTLMKDARRFDCRRTAAEIALGGRPLVLRSPHQAIQSGIAMIHQELMPIPDLTVAENIMLGREPASRLLGWINRRAVLHEARRLLDLLGTDLPLGRKMGELRVAEMQTVEIAKALGQNARVLIMDEPTASISDREVEALFKVIAMLKHRGVAIVYITHKMDEVFRVADRITVLRDGARTSAPTRSAKSTARRSLRGWWTPMSQTDRRTRRAKGDCGPLSVRHLGLGKAFHDVNLRCGAAKSRHCGLVGAGRTEWLARFSALAPVEDGDIRVAGRLVRIRRPADAMRHGIGMVTEDRKGSGLVPTMPVMHNMTLASLADCCAGPFIRHAKRPPRRRLPSAFSIKTGGRRSAVNQLSGGNQQKVVIARSLLAGPSIIILDEPTRGIDIGAKAEVYSLIARLAEQGRSVILVSSELPEVLALSDRLLVMRQGSIAAELDPDGNVARGSI